MAPSCRCLDLLVHDINDTMFLTSLRTTSFSTNSIVGDTVPAFVICPIKGFKPDVPKGLELY